MSTHQDLLPEPHTRTSKRISKDRQRRIFYIEDLRRSSYKNFLRAFQKNFIQAPLQMIFSQGPVPDHVGRPRGFTRTSARTPHKDLYKMTQRLLTEFQEDLHKIGRIKDLDQDLHARTPKRFSQDHHKRTCCCCCWRIQEPSESHPQELTYKQL